MENSSMMSSINKAVSFKEGTDHPEESGWTQYFDDFFVDNRENYTCISSDFKTSSFVSDAASCAACKFSDLGPEQSFKKLSIKKKRTRKVLADVDDDLEDTASSPCNSPKVSESSQLQMNRSKRDDNVNSSLGKGSKQTDDDRTESGFIGTETYCTELKKRGLCLVPMSMLMKYLG